MSDEAWVVALLIVIVIGFTIENVVDRITSSRDKED